VIEETPFQIGFRSARALLVPAVILVLAGLALVITNYNVPAVGGALAHVAEWKRAYGLGFVIGSSALLAGFAPWLLRMVIPGLRPAKPVPELLFSLGWWVSMLIVVDAFYRFLGMLFDDRGWPFAAVVMAKVLCDQLLFTTFLAAPANALSHLWKDSGYSFAALRRELGPGWFRRWVLPNLIPNYMVWFPGVALVYSMPANLQLPMANLIGCFWSLMCIQISARSKGRVSVEPELAT
jgi:hypothetical protein